MKYPVEYRKRMVAKFRGWGAMIDALNSDSEMVGHLLKDCADNYQMKPWEIIRAFEENRSQDVLNQSKQAQEYIDLYHEWKDIWDDQEVVPGDNSSSDLSRR